MNRTRASLLRWLGLSESGQTTVVLAVMLIALLGMAGFVVDMGRALYTYRELQATTDAAALAGASVLPLSTAVTVATRYSSVNGALNQHNNMPNVTMVPGYPKVLCLSTLTARGMTCAAPGNGNALQVRQQITIPLLFMRLLGKSSLTMGAVATAATRGSSPVPFNVAVIVDTTLSMNTYDSSCGATRLTCALSGVQVLLQKLSPCPATVSTCGTVTGGNVSNPVDKVSLYTFPGFTSSSQAAYDYDCSSTAPQTVYYTDPVRPVYQVVGYSSDYKNSASTSTLTSTSNLVRAAGGKTSCTGLQAVGPWGTYFAGVIYAAQTDLAAQAAANGNQNVIVFLGDGDANVPYQYMPFASRTSGTYPSSKNECVQAVAAAAAATAAGTRFYSVAYGAAMSGCSTDTSSITPCQTMQQMASKTSYFYSDYTASGGSSSCVSSQSVTSLSDIFSSIGTDLTVGRLIPDNTT